MRKRRDITRWLLRLLVAACPCLAWGQQRLTYYYIAALSEAKEDASSMADLLQHCLEIDPENPAANYNLGLLYYAIGQDSVCMEKLKKAVENDPRNPTYKESLASVLMATRQPDEAICTEGIDKFIFNQHT